MTDTADIPIERHVRIDRDLDAIIDKLKDAPGDLMLSPKETSLVVNRSVSALAADRSGKAGGGIPFIRRAPGSIRYRIGDIREWAIARRYRTTSQYQTGTAIISNEPIKATLRIEIERNRALARQFSKQADELASLLSMLDEPPANTKEPASADA